MSRRNKCIARRKTYGLITAAISGAILGTGSSTFAQSTGDRVLGLDVSIFQGNISQTTWNNLQKSIASGGDNRQFVIIRSSRGGTTGYDHRAGGYASGNNTQFTASQRYDDPNFVQNIVRATTAGMFAGAYHLVRPDIIAGTLNSDGSTNPTANTGADEADHFIQMAGPWMRPGYLVPMYDFEKGDGIRTDEQLAQFSLDFSNRIYQVMGIRPSIYGSGTYFDDLQGASSTLRNQLAQPAANGPSVVSPAYTKIVSARYPAGSGNVYNGDIQHENPSDTFVAMYGPWDDYGTAQPWTIWQYSSGGGLVNYSGALDLDVAAGGTEFLKDSLVPAVWMTDSSGDWGTLSNWNSGQTPTQPPVISGQLTPLATGPLPTPRHPGDAGTGPTSGQNDTVILERPNASITITLSSGSYDIRKLYVRETLAMTGGSLNVNYIPVAESTPLSAEFTAPVSLSGAAAFSLHTLQIDPTQTFTISGGTFTFNTVDLARTASAGGIIQLTGNTTFAPLSGAQAQIINVGSGAGSLGALDLGAGSRVLTVNDGASAIDLDVLVPIQNGTLTKTGAGTMRLSAANSLSGALTVSGGTVLLTAANNLSGATSVVTTQATTGGTVQMSNNISVNLPLTIGGAGSGTATGTAPGSIGALDNLTDTNTWAGSITLNGTGSSAGDAQLNQIGATAGILSVSGVIQNGAGTHWAKTGNGDVVLTGSSPNTYTGMTRVLGGRLILEKDFALGAGGSDTTTSGNTFQLSGSNSTIAFRAPASSPVGFTYGADEWIHLDGNGGGSAGLGQLDNLGGANTFAGKIGLAGTTVAGAMNCSLGVSAGSLELSGGIYARSTSGLPRNITKLGAGTLVISGDSNAAPTNSADASLTASTFNVGAGMVQLKSPSAATTNLPGVTTWNATGTGVLQVTSGLLQTTTVSASGGGVISLKSGGGKTLRASTVTIGTGSKIDLTDNKMIVDYTSGSPLGVWSGSYNGITGQIATGRATGTWNGPGIITSMTAALAGASPMTTIGVAEASDALGFASGTRTWKGQSVDATTVLALYTYAGDANLDGRVNADDYFQIDSNYNKPQSAAGYFKGDFNYDGKINGDDYALIDMNFQSQGSVLQGGAPLGGVSSVPEPAAIGILALPALVGLRRRRGRRN